MKYNIQEVAALQPDYLGFIFYDKSKRDFEGMDIPVLPDGIQKVGVFVDADIAFAKARITKHNLDIVQLHGNESPEYIKQLCNVTASAVEMWKVFSIKDQFDFRRITPYEGLVDAFLFDTKGAEKGGNGYTFDWSVLQEYPSKTPFVLSGGIGLEQLPDVQKILATELPIMALDVNSRFEVKPGKKDVSKLKTFIDELGLKQIQNTSAKAEDSSTPEVTLNKKTLDPSPREMNIIEEDEEQFYFYITTNTHNKILYTGFTVNLKSRIEEHRTKKYKGSHTAKYNLDKLIYFETFKTVNEARTREIQVKKWNRAWKENLINDKNPDWKDLNWML